MKKILIAMCLFTVGQSIKAQTQAETLEWFNVRKVDADVRAKFTSLNIYNEDSYNFPEIINWKDIKEITAKDNEIIIKGLVIRRCLGTGCQWDNIPQEGTKLRMRDADKELIEKFVKALKHMATLNGAKFIKEDLF